MKKIILLIFATTLLLGCKKNEVRKELEGCWVYEHPEGTHKASGELWLDGVRFVDKKKCSVLFYDYDNSLYYQTDKTVGSWKLKPNNQINFDWGKTSSGEKIVYPLPGNYDLILDDIENNVIYIQGDKFVRIECNEIQYYE